MNTTPSCSCGPADAALGPDDVSQELDFKGTIIRAVKARGTLWFSARDLVEAMRYTEYTYDLAASSPRIPDCCRCYSRELEEPSLPGDPETEVLLLSPIGVWLWTHHTDAMRGQGLASWSKRMAEELAPGARRDDPATFLTFGPDNSLPPYPAKYSGRKREWIDLKERSYYLPITPWPRTNLAA